MGRTARAPMSQTDRNEIPNRAAACGLRSVRVCFELPLTERRSRRAAADLDSLWTAVGDLGRAPALSGWHDGYSRQPAPWTPPVPRHRLRGSPERCGGAPRDQACGRVEHVRSGTSALFSSAEELVRFTR